jgi:hypothetical protein
MGYWSDEYPRKATLQGTDVLLIQDSDDNTTTVDDIKDYVEENSTIINSLAKWTYETISTGLVIGRKGKERILYIIGYTSISNTFGGFCTLGATDVPKYTVGNTVAVEGVGACFVSLSTSGIGSLYTMNMGSYLVGKCYGTISYQVA